MLYIPDFTGFLPKPVYMDADFLHRKYIQESRSIAEIAVLASSSKMVIRKHLLLQGVVLREPSKPHGRPSNPKYGERLVYGKATAHLGEKRVINAILELRSQGMTLRQVASFLSQMGVPTKERGHRWHPQMVKRILDRAAQPNSKVEENSYSELNLNLKVQ
jgi:hypothetical protein